MIVLLIRELDIIFNGVQAIVWCEGISRSRLRTQHFVLFYLHATPIRYC